LSTRYPAAARRACARGHALRPGYPHVRMLRLPVLMAGLAVAALSAGCTTIAQVANLGDAQCNASLESGLVSILNEQGEKDEAAATLAHRTDLMLSAAELGPRPFLVASPSGTDYTFFIQKKRSHCLLRLYGRRKGFVSYTNNLTYIATRELAGCTCRE
jgi:hypothetical protein